MAQTSYPFDGTATTETQYSALFRELQETGVAGSADSLTLNVSADAGGMRVFVQPGFAIVRGHAYNSTAVEQLTISNSGGTARTDRVVLRLDPTANSIVLAVITGTPGAGLPALTQTDTGIYELLLADVTVGVSVTNIAPAAVADRRTFGGVTVRAWTDTTKPANPRQGTLGFNTTTGGWEFWDGTWKTLVQSVPWTLLTGLPSTFPPSAHGHAISEITGRIDAAGLASVTDASVAAGGASSAVTVTFPVGRFSAPPVVTATVQAAAGGTAYAVARVASVTATNCVIYLYNVGSTTTSWSAVPVAWHATPAG